MEHIRTPSLEAFEDRWHFSHIVATRGLLLLSGVTGTGIDGLVSSDPAEQFERAFAHLRLYLEAAGASLEDVVEMTSYHVDLRQHLDAFVAAKDRHIAAPYPACRRSASRSSSPRGRWWRCARSPPIRRREARSPHGLWAGPPQSLRRRGIACRRRAYVSPGWVARRAQD